MPEQVKEILALYCKFCEQHFPADQWEWLPYLHVHKCPNPNCGKVS